MVDLRKATQKDFPAIRRLIWRVRINPMGLDWRHFIIAVDPENQLIGCGQIKPHRDGSSELASIAVQPEYQGQGIGKALIERLLSETRVPLFLMCRPEMEPYYQKFGFQRLDFNEMTPYFQRLLKVMRILIRFFPSMGEPLVMRKPA